MYRRMLDSSSGEEFRIALFLVKSDRLLLCRRFEDSTWQPSCIGTLASISAGEAAADLLRRDLSVRAHVSACGTVDDLHVYRAVSAAPIMTSHEIDEIEWVLIEELPWFLKSVEVSATLRPTLNVFLSALGSSVRLR